MSNSKAVQILFPTGRLVQGNLYEANTEDADGNPLLVKNGANKGQAREDWFFAVAIPKTRPGEQWWETQWGQQMMAVGARDFPNVYQHPSFSWKIVDGDSQVPNKKGKKPCEQVGHAGNWVVRFSSGFAPKIVNKDGSAAITEPNAVKPGYFVQVLASCNGNNSSQQSGVYLNHNAVSLQGYGEEIVYGPDLAGVGFGQGALPAGASAAPVGGLTPAAAAQLGAPGMPAAPGLPAAPGMPAMGVPAMPPAPAVPGMAVTPNVGYMAPQAGAVPQAGAAPMAPPMAPPPAPAMPAAPARQMTPAAGGQTYEAYIGAGWTDQQLIQHGLMLP